MCFPQEISYTRMQQYFVRSVPHSNFSIQFREQVLDLFGLDRILISLRLELAF